jgi:hypothetical protein
MVDFGSECVKYPLFILPNEQIMDILYIARKCGHVNALEKFRLCHSSKQGLRLNNRFAETCNPIFDTIIYN